MTDKEQLIEKRAKATIRDCLIANGLWTTDFQGEKVVNIIAMFWLMDWEELLSEVLRLCPYTHGTRHPAYQCDFCLWQERIEELIKPKENKS